MMNMAYSSNYRWLMMNMAHSFADHWLLNMMMMTGLSVHDATDPPANARSAGFTVMMRGFCPDNRLYSSLFMMMMRGFFSGYLDSASSSRRHACRMMNIMMMDIMNNYIMMMFLYGMMNGLSMYRLVTLDLTSFMSRLQSFNMNLWLQFMTTMRDHAFNDLSNNSWVFPYNLTMMFALAVDNLTLDVALVPMLRGTLSIIITMRSRPFNINLLRMIMTHNGVLNDDLTPALQEMTDLSIRRDVILQLTAAGSFALIDDQTVV